MEITPSTFDEADRYWESADREIRRLLVLHGYGITPGSPRNVNLVFANKTVSIQIHHMEGVTRSGLFFQIAGDTITLNEPRDKGKECYLVVHSDVDVEQEINNTFYRVPHYHYDFCSLREIDDDCLPFAKLIKESDIWKIQELYIPPCMTVGADPELTSIVTNTQVLLEGIKKCLSPKVGNLELLPVILQKMELDNYTMSETPSCFFLLLKKISFTLSCLNISGLNLPLVPQVGLFDSNDVLKCLVPFLEYIQEYHNVVTHIESAPKKEEPPRHFDVWDAEL